MKPILSFENLGKRRRSQQKAADASSNNFREVLADLSRKLLDVSKINALGWRAKTDLREGIARAWQCFLEQADVRQ